MLRRTALRRRRATPRRSDRVRDVPYMLWVKTLTCAASHLPDHVCEGPIEADHVLPRPLGRKCSDFGGVIALCSLAHRQRTDFAGPFRSFDRAAMRGFVAQALLDTADAWRRHTAAPSRTDSMEAM